MTLLRDVWEWVTAVVENWHGYTSGTVIAFALEYGEKLWDWKPPKKWIYIILLVGFLASIFSAWREQLKRAERAEFKLDEKNPGLVGEMQMFMTGVSENVTGALIVATISNLPTGSPSIAKNYELVIDLPSGKEITATPYFVPKTVTIDTPNGPKTFYQEDALYTKTANPIQPGGEQTGLLLFQISSMPPKVPGFPPEELSQKGTKATLRFVDIMKNSYSCSRVIGETPNTGFQYYPGMRPPTN